MRGPTLTQAIVLRSVPYGEGDRVVTLLGRTTGRVGALARGARKSQRRFAGGLGVGATGEAALHERAGAELMALERFDTRAARVDLGADVARAAHAAYALELCDRLCPPRQPEAPVYDLLDELLNLLEAQGASAIRLRAFELRLLAALGLAPAVDACVACGRSDLGAEDVRWDATRGGVMCEGCARGGLRMPAGARTALARLGGTALALAVETGREASWSPAVAAACRDALQASLAEHIPGKLRSLEFIAKLHAHGAGESTR